MYFAGQYGTLSGAIFIVFSLVNEATNFDDDLEKGDTDAYRCLRFPPDPWSF